MCSITFFDFLVIIHTLDKHRNSVQSSVNANFSTLARCENLYIGNLVTKRKYKTPPSRALDYIMVLNLARSGSFFVWGKGGVECSC